MNILLLLTQDIESPSGLGRYFPIGKNLVKLGHSVKIATLHPDYNNLERKRFSTDDVEINYVSQMHVIKKSGIKTYHSPLKLLWLSIWATIKLTSAALGSGADTIIIGKPHPMNSIAAIITKIFMGKRLILDIDDDESGSGHFQRQFERRIIEFFERKVPNFADKITTNTHYSMDKLIHNGIQKEKIFYLPNGIDPARFPTPSPSHIKDLNSKLNFHGKKVISYIGSMSTTNHAVDELIKALPMIIEVEPDARLLLVGGGENIQDLKVLVEDLNVDQYTQFIGQVPPDEVVHYYGVSDITIDPVRDDRAAKGRSPLKLFESWFCGVPFVTGDTGDRSWMIKTMENGILVEPGNPQSLAEGIIQVLQSEKLSDKLIENGRLSVQSYLWSTLSNDLNTIL